MTKMCSLGHDAFGPKWIALLTTMSALFPAHANSVARKARGAPTADEQRSEDTHRRLDMDTRTVYFCLSNAADSLIR